MKLFSAALTLLLTTRAAFGGSLPGTAVDDHNEAGYETVRMGTVDLFYVLFESRNSPETDPLLIWFSGGPGCSSQLAMFGENGPYWINEDDLSLELNPHSWTEAANVIWVDQPAGTGFSHGMLAPSEAILAEDVYELLQKIYVKHPKFAKLDLYVFGESYAGHYVPVIARKIVDENAKLAALSPVERGSKVHLPLVGAAIGNGLTRPLVQYLYYTKFAKMHGLVSKKTLLLMEAMLPVCEAFAAGCDFLGNNASDPKGQVERWASCESAYVFCNMGQITPIQNTGINLYDVREMCDKSHPLCYDFSPIERYLNQPHVQEAMGTTGRTWAECNRMVDMTLVLTGDWSRSYDSHVAAALNAGVRFLVYAGDQDAICNWLGNRAWTRAMLWRHTLEFNKAANVTWMVDENVAGSFQSAKGLTFLKVSDAGHMVPRDQPRNALQIVRDFFDNKFDAEGVAAAEALQPLIDGSLGGASAVGLRGAAVATS